MILIYHINDLITKRDVILEDLDISHLSNIPYNNITKADLVIVHNDQMEFRIIKSRRETKEGFYYKQEILEIINTNLK